jgi:hypothetical protein
MSVIVGSAALLHHLMMIASPAEQTFRRIADIDVICKTAEMQKLCGFYNVKPRPLSNAHWIADIDDNLKHIEFEVIECSPSGKAYYDYCNGNGFAPIEVLYSLKRSHRFEPRHWQKHIGDYHLLKNLVGGVDKLADITKMRVAEMKAHHLPSLNKTKDEFFKDDVSNHVFEHDQIHEIMAHRERPMFEYISDGSSTVKSSRAKWEELSLPDRVKCVLEEAYVIALERGVVPMLYEGKKLADSKSALQWSLMRICTTLTGGWFREFAVENFPLIWQSRDDNYVAKFLTAVDEGRIKRIGEVPMG